MPSGAKKRKAAKKKKGNQNQNESKNHSYSASTPARPHGEDDRESDVGEVSSPISQDHQKLPIEEEDGEIEKDDPSSAGAKENEIKIEDELGKKDGITDHGDETASSGSSSSTIRDDESHGIKKGKNASSIASVEVADSFSGKSVEPVFDASTAENGDTVPSPSSEKITLSSEIVEFDVLESTLDENGNRKCCSAEGRTSTYKSSLNETSPGKEGNAQKECVTQENGDRSTSPYIASTAAVDNGAQPMKDSVVTLPVPTPSPYPIQKTSWKGCCGLFEVFSASIAN